MSDWRARCIRAQQPVWWKFGHARGFTRLDKIESSSWYLCAVGEQYQRHPEAVVLLPRDYFHGRPADELLTQLGGSSFGFARAVAANNPWRALDLLDQIEDRVLILKRRGGS